jgi:exodeoxyribonuclease V beta subunit
VTAINRLDPLQVPLDGLSLIEANAGTGKTWTITALHLRLLLETAQSVESILVVTFTDVATAELRDRIRGRLVEARIAFQQQTAPRDDPLLAGLLTRIANRHEAADRLTAALTHFDQAPIYTLHGFCQRVLGDRAFESLMPFDTEIVPDESLLLQEIVDDFWRKTLYDASPLFVRFVLDAGLSPEQLRSELNGRIGKPYLEIRKPVSGLDATALERAYERAYVEARTRWLADRAAIEAQLASSGQLNGSAYRPDLVRTWLQFMASCLRSERPALALFKQFPKFTNQALRAGTRKGGTPPEHPFYEACSAMLAANADLRSAYERRVWLLRAELLAYCNDELQIRKRRRGLQSYDDLLLNLERALRHETRGEPLAAALRARYKAALIDEFQDTDPVQYQIFRTIYQGTGLPAFMVGDPKQSIYSFRGADVFAYLRARNDAQSQHTLNVNWRSQRTLLAAVNRLFADKAAPFVNQEIPFRASEPAPGNRGYCIIDGESPAPFELWLIAGKSGKALNKDDAVQLAAEATAAEIARLLNLGARGKARIGVPVDEGVRERPLCGADVAVLVRTHRQAQAMRTALRNLGVASVDRGGSSVFASEEADELHRVLMAVAEPGREALVRAALVTELMGCSGAALHALTLDEMKWEEMVESFRSAHVDWRERGFIGMARALLQRHGIMERLLEHADGERRVTNLLHLIELVHRETAHHGIGATLEWFAEKRRAPGRNNEEELLRLENDENLVKVLTVHAAKGLEFPLVFCPCAWDGRSPPSRGEAITFHDPEQGYAAVLDMGSETIDVCRPLAQRERLAEDVRLLYVALTRARYRCWMVWGHVNGAQHAAPAWLLHGSGSPDAPISVSLSDDIIARDLLQIESRAEGTIRVRPIPAEAAKRFSAPETQRPLLAPRTFSGKLHDTWRVSSFSALAHARAVESPDYDGAVHRPEAGALGPLQDIHAFPRGARAGRCLHAIFEQVDFAGFSRSSAERIVAHELAAHGFAAQWIPVVTAMIERVIATPLDEAGRLRLNDISRDRRFDELEFYYPIGGVSDAGLRSLLLDWRFPEEIRERIGALTFAPVHGYMKGYIDLVFEADGRFYFADYKSNWLGGGPEAYGQIELRRAMGREAYYLQYLIYCVALHRYLGVRIPGYDYEMHFGGVRYLFLRGMEPKSGMKYGVYADQPAAGLIHEFDRYLGSAR